MYVRTYVRMYVYNIYIATDSKPRERFKGLLFWTIRILCNLQYKLLFRNLVTSQFWRKNGVSKSIAL